jgi:geranylgeranyl diphosphate synthase type II
VTGNQFHLHAYLSDARALVEASLLNYLGGATDNSRIQQAMTYSVMAGGKRLRPILCMAAAETVGGAPRRVLPAACALELIHTYSLIHDDLPAMDDDRMRRGNPTCHVEFDEATAILAGDGLLTLAFEIMATAGLGCKPDDQRRWLSTIAMVAAAAGYQGMIEGQMRDMALESANIPHDELEALHRLKTGKMIEACVDAGALLSGAAEDQRNALNTYARQIGLAFQVTDDILNVTGDSQRMGKATGTDQERGKNTYPALLGLDAAHTLAAQLIDNALMALDSFDNKANPLRAIAHYVVERNR